MSTNHGGANSEVASATQKRRGLRRHQLGLLHRAGDFADPVRGAGVPGAEGLRHQHHAPRFRYSLISVFKVYVFFGGGAWVGGGVAVLGWGFGGCVLRVWKWAQDEIAPG